MLIGTQSGAVRRVQRSTAFRSQFDRQDHARLANIGYPREFDQRRCKYCHTLRGGLVLLEYRFGIEDILHSQCRGAG